MKTTHTCLAVLSVFLFARDAVADFWTDPVAISGVNTGLDEGAPFPTYDGQSFYFSRQQKNPSGVPIGHLFGATGPSSSGQFTSVQELSVNDISDPFTATSVIYGWVSEDNLRLYYSESSSSTRSIKMTKRTSPGNLWVPGSGVGGFSGLNVANPSLTRDERTIFFTSPDPIGPGGQGGWDIWMGTWDTVSSSFIDFTNLSTVNSGGADMHPRLSADGSTLYFASNRNGEYQLFQATWLDSDLLFGTPEPLLIDGLPVYGQYPAVSADGQDLYFAQWVDTTRGYDIFVSHAVPVPGAAVLGLLGLSCAGWWCRHRAT